MRRSTRRSTPTSTEADRRSRTEAATRSRSARTAPRSRSSRRSARRSRSRKTATVWSSASSTAAIARTSSTATPRASCPTRRRRSYLDHRPRVQRDHVRLRARHDGHRRHRGPRRHPAIRNEYDPNGRLLKHIDADGNEIVYDHDLDRSPGGGHRPQRQPDGLRLRRARAGDVGDRPAGRTTRYEYDAPANQTAVVDALGHRTEYAYDAKGRVTLVRDPLGHETQTTYDAAGHVLTTTDALHRVTSDTYDGAGRLLTSRNALDRLVAENTWNADGTLADLDGRARQPVELRVRRPRPPDAPGQPGRQRHAVALRRRGQLVSGRASSLTRPPTRRRSSTSRSRETRSPRSYVYDQNDRVTGPLAQAAPRRGLTSSRTRRTRRSARWTRRPTAAAS